MIILTTLSYIGGILGFVFVTLSIASGLYYVSEFVEEHAALTKKVLKRAVYGVISLQMLLLLVDRLPAPLLILSMLSHLVYLTNLANFPFISLTSPKFLASCILVLSNHFLWFRHFSQVQASSQGFNNYNKPRQLPPTFGQIASFFGICIWLVPFGLFVSLSAGDLVLPSTSTMDHSDSNVSTTLAHMNRRRTGLVKQVYSRLGQMAAPVLKTFGLGPADGLTPHQRLA